MMNDEREDGLPLACAAGVALRFADAAQGRWVRAEVRLGGKSVG